MAKYSIGDNVIKSTSEKRGVIISVLSGRRGRQLYRVKWDDCETDELEVNLLPSRDISDPFERCKNGIFGYYSEYSKINTSFKILNSNNSTISSLKASKTLFRAYQFKPLLKFLNSPNRRLLVADEVGLGKTIEAGHIMLELKARRELHNVLIVCPKSLQRKWRDELLFKFGLQFKIYESHKDLIADIQERRVSVFAIINYEKIRLKQNADAEGKSGHNFVDFISQSNTRFGLVLCDEAHKLRNRDTQTFNGAKLIMAQADTAVFLTATPIMISTKNLYNLLNLLDNTRYYNPQIFDNLLQQNRPFVEALTELNHNVSLSAIAKKLNESEVVTRYFSNEVEIFSNITTVGETFADDPMYKEIMQMLNGEDNSKSRARLQYLISSMSMMNNIFSRTRKREVTTDMSQAERKPHMCKVVLTENERAEFDKVIEEYIDDNSYTSFWGEEVLTQGGALGLVQKKRQVASSVYAYLNSEHNLENGVDEYAKYKDAKFEKLLQIIEEVFKHGIKKIVVFALFRKTLKYLQLRFKQRGFGTLLIHGLIENRMDILDEFKNNPDAHILLSSEVGSEGLDMQFCNSMVNYDLPWNPMVVEQRIGRIDRFGQKSPIVNIYNIIVADSIQEDIYIRLLDRIGIFRGAIGDMEAILDAPLERGGSVTIQDVYNKLEKELFTNRLTVEEKQRKISEIELAIENEKESIKHLKDGLENSMTNDAYFKEEINRILNNNAYVTEVELRNYLNAAILQNMATCSLVEVEDQIYELTLPLSEPKIIKNFLTMYQSPGDENDALFRHFKNDIEDKRVLRITFNQQKAYDNNKLLFINIYHPLIQACLNYFNQTDNSVRTSFCYAIKGDEVLRMGLSYYLIVYQMNVMRKVMGEQKNTKVLQPLLYSINDRCIVCDENIVNRIFSRSQTDGVEHNPTNDEIESDMIQDMRYDFAEAISDAKAKYRDELMLLLKSEIQRNEKQTRDYYDTMIENQRKYIQDWEREMKYAFYDREKRIRELQGAIRLANVNIQRFNAEKDERLARVKDDLQVEINDNIISLSLIKIV